MNEQDWRAVLPDVNEEDVEQAIRWCQDIVNCLVRYAGKTQEEAERIVVSSYISKFLDEDPDYIFREIPYYWAMELLYGRGNALWYKDEKLWPPPSDYQLPESDE